MTTQDNEKLYQGKKSSKEDHTCTSSVATAPLFLSRCASITVPAASVLALAISCFSSATKAADQTVETNSKKHVKATETNMPATAV
jgi:hypothetical protein